MEQAIRKTKRKLRSLLSGKLKLLLSILILIIIVALVFTLTTNNQNKKTNVAKYEITKTDIFSLEDFNANEISVKGVKVGDRLSDVIDIIGTPDLRTDFDVGVSTLEYSKKIGLDKTGLIITSDNDVVTSITIREPFDEFLLGKTKTNYTKDKIYGMFGIPDKTIFTPIEEGSFIVIRIMRYSSKGIEFIIRKENVIGFSLFLNDDAEIPPGTHTTEIIPSKPEVIM